jgi:hypothetical protein
MRGARSFDWSWWRWLSRVLAALISVNEHQHAAQTARTFCAAQDPTGRHHSLVQALR